MLIMSSEKLTQAKLFEFLVPYDISLNTNSNKEIFGKKIPDGYFIRNNQLMIFECKQKKSQWKNAKAQLLMYKNLSEKYAQENNLEIVPIFVYGTEEITVLVVKDFDKNILKDFTQVYNIKEIKQKLDFNPHKFNQYIYDNFPMISSEERLKIIISVLLVKSLNIELKEPLYLRCIETEEIYHMGEYFKFLSNEPYSSCVNIAFKYFEKLSSEYILQILHMCFVEISKWSFKGKTGKNIRQSLTQQEGAVLTPPDIVKLMTKELNISALDIICDPCCGTGNFLLEAINYTKFVIGNELDLTRAIIAKHGLIISGINSDNITNKDCMLGEYIPEFDYLLLNPPYDSHKEQKICLKFINLSRKGGAIIIPSNNFRDNKFMEELNKICYPKKLIQLNKKVFYPVANVETTILIYSKEKKYNLEEYDFTEDGYETNRIHGRIYKENKEPKLITNEIITEDNNLKENENNIYVLLYNDIIDKLAITLKNNVLTSEFKKNITNEKVTTYKITDLFEYISKGKHQINKTNNGIYPLISATIFNNGIVKYIDSYSFEENLITVSTVDGTSFVQNGKFSATSSVHILKPIHKDIDYLIVTKLMTKKFNKIYHWGYTLSIERLMTEEINYIDVKYNINDFIKYINNLSEKEIQLIQKELILIKNLKIDFVPVIPFMDKIDIESIKRIFAYGIPIKSEKEIILKPFKISDLFKIVKIKKQYDLKENNGKYPLIGASKNNNGIIKYIDKYSHEFNTPIITISGFGSSGYCFVQYGKIAIRGHGSILCIELNEKYKELNLNLIAFLMTQKFIKIYSWNFSLTKERLLNQEIYLPTINNELSNDSLNGYLYELLN